MKWEENRAPIPAPDAIARRARQLANAHTASRMSRKRRNTILSGPAEKDLQVSVDPDFDAAPARIDSLDQIN